MVCAPDSVRDVASAIASSRVRSAEAVAKVGIDAGTTFDKNSALPLTIYTLPLR